MRCKAELFVTAATGVRFRLGTVIGVFTSRSLKAAKPASNSAVDRQGFMSVSASGDGLDGWLMCRDQDEMHGVVSGWQGHVAPITAQLIIGRLVVDFPSERKVISANVAMQIPPAGYFAISGIIIHRVSSR